MTRNSIILPARKRVVKVGKDIYYLPFPQMKFWLIGQELYGGFYYKGKVYDMPFSNVDCSWICLGNNTFLTLEEAVQIFFSSKFQYINKNFDNYAFQTYTGLANTGRNVKNFLKQWASWPEFPVDYFTPVQESDYI